MASSVIRPSLTYSFEFLRARAPYTVHSVPRQQNGPLLTKPVKLMLLKVPTAKLVLTFSTSLMAHEQGFGVPWPEVNEGVVYTDIVKYSPLVTGATFGGAPTQDRLGGVCSAARISALDCFCRGNITRVLRITI